MDANLEFWVNAFYFFIWIIGLCAAVEFADKECGDFLVVGYIALTFAVGIVVSLLKM